MPAATALQVTGPPSGGNQLPSLAFTISANGTLSSGHSLVLTDSPSGGTFNTSSLIINAATPVTSFVYTPATAGVKTITISDNNGLTSCSITYTATSVAGTITSQPLRTNSGTLQSNVSLSYVAVYSATSPRLLVAERTNISTDSSGVFIVSDPALVPSTSYRVDWTTSTGEHRMPSATAV